MDELKKVNESIKELLAKIMAKLEHIETLIK